MVKTEQLNRLALDVVILALSLGVLTWGLGDYGFYEPHEGHFAGIGSEMVLRSDGITPHLNGSPYLNKPPLLYWLVAGSLAGFGPGEWAARLPLALCGWLGVLVAWKWGRDLWGEEAGRVAAVLLTLSAGWFIFTHQLLIDVLLATLVLGSYYCLWRSLIDPRPWGYLLGFYGLLALCFLAKGLIGLVLVGVGGLGLRVRRGQGLLRELRLPLGIGLAIAMLLPWAIAVERANPGFFQYFLINEHFNRAVDVRWPPDYAVSKVSAWGYLGMALVWGLPWTLFLPWVVRFVWESLTVAVGALATQPYRDGIWLLTLGCLGPVTLFLPLSSRLLYYSLAALPFFALLCAGWWVQGHNHWPKLAAGLLTLIGVGAGLSLLVLPGVLASIQRDNPLMAGLSGLAIPGAIALSLGFLVAGVSLFIRKSRLALAALAIAFVWVYGLVVQGFVLFQETRSAKGLMAAAVPCLNPETLWTFEGSRELGAAGAMSFYLNRFEELRVPGRYRTVLVLSEGGPNRILPAFPGAEPAYALTKTQLQQLWDSPRSVVFVTDFLRQENDPRDRLWLNLPTDAGEPLLVIGPRRLYGNREARKAWCQN